MGGFGGQSAQAPRLDTGASSAFTQSQIDQLIQSAPEVARVIGNVGRGQAAQSTVFGLNMLTDPNGALRGSMRSEADQKRGGQLSSLKKQLDKGEITQKQYRQRIASVNKEHNARVAQINKAQPLQQLQKAFAPEFARRDTMLGSLDKARQPTVAYNRAQAAFQRGIDAQQVGQREASLSQAQAAGMGQVADISAQQVAAGQLGDTLMGRAMDMARSDGTLSAEASRDAVQAARAGMAARGMATGNAALGAELLNRDRFARQRMFQDLGFAQGIQGQDLERQLANAGNALRADMSNQQTQFGREQIISGNQQQANLANMQAANNMSQFNTTLAADTDRYNAGQRDSTNRFNIGLLGQSAAMADAERARSLGMQQDAYNFSLSTNPRMMLAGLGQPYANLQTPGLQQLGAIVGSGQPMYGGGQFSSGGNGLHTTISGLVGAGFGAYFGGPMGAAAGYQMGTGLGQATTGSFMDPTSWSDKRMKTDIKPLGTLSNVLKIPAYEYRYKGEKKKRKGVMAQDVQKVLPEAVAEVDYKGKKRLAIKPAVIGAALAQELTEQSKAVAA